MSTVVRGFRPPSKIDTLYDRNGGYEETYEIHGVMTHPAFSIVSIYCVKSQESESCWSYNRLDKVQYQDVEVGLRRLDICISDVDGSSANVIHDAHRDAIICGRKFSNVRIFKKKGDGLMSTADKEHGYSYESHYPVLGWLTWSDLHSPAIPNWAYEPSNVRFTLDSIPEHHWDLDRELDAPPFSTKRR
jgi:hypothetical protein